LFSFLHDVDYIANDRTVVVAPPYATPVEQSLISTMREHVQEGIWGWPRIEARRYWLAGGGIEAAFEQAYDDMLRIQREDLAQFDAGTHVELSASVLFV